jgi:hypothetical protein
MTLKGLQSYKGVKPVGATPLYGIKSLNRWSVGGIRVTDIKRSRAFYERSFGQLRIETLPGIWELGFGTSGTVVEALALPGYRAQVIRLEATKRY